MSTCARRNENRYTGDVTARTLALAAVLAAGCAHAPIEYDAETRCRLVAQSRPSIAAGSLSAADLVDLAEQTPAEPSARSVRRQQIAIAALTIFGGAALIAGFVTFFVVDPTQPAGRAAGGAIIGSAIGAGGGALILGFTAHRAAARAQSQLLWFADHCAAH
jgi:hypothetical protein